MKKSPKQTFTITCVSGEPNSSHYLRIQQEIRNRIASRQQQAAQMSARAAQGNTKSTIGSSLATLGTIVTVASIAALNSLDDIGKE